MDVHDKNRVGRDEDTRCCALCGEYGDGDQELAGRLLNVDANKWVFLLLLLWCLFFFILGSCKLRTMVIRST